ncbi:DegT/DnrJ/EryC1/StrS family aminotransferase [Oleiagrimonas sp. C23AA]|uniref:DegT/DnrJ/EryC1/StrS family aminotransferase n=1 Tax=Oleiagrimonas sp. C23AA TaxID=2719047 RepID=UPI0014223985|nr:DegT/DnrJ/EryC1/StrS family aminotransferase [Oleiagrimonas sp. C23AA]NII11122.1 nucleotide sugar aminotransferase [Oleiagrimonas sp. C23AA]
MWTPRPSRQETAPTAGLALEFSDLLGCWDRPLAHALSPHLGTDQAILTCSGTAALMIALRCLAGESHRHQVVLPAYTCPLLVRAVAAAGLVIRLCDNRPGHFEMDPQVLKTLCGPDTLAVIPAHLGGRLADMTQVTAITHDCGATVIEDAAQALGARHADGTAAGLAGDIGFVSMAAGKGLSIYEGGLLMSRDASRLQALRAVAGTVPRFSLWEARRMLELIGYALFYRPGGLRMAYGRPLRRALRKGDLVNAVGDQFGAKIPLHRVSRWREAVGVSAAERLSALLKFQRKQARERLPSLRAIPGITVLDDVDRGQGTWPLFMLVMTCQADRDAALSRVWHRGLGVSRMFIHALPDYDYLRDVVPREATPRASDFAARTLTISNSPWLSDADFGQILQVLQHPR